MSISAIITAAAVVGGVGIIIGLILGVASNIFKVEVDERVEKVRAELPGNNCGGCGFAGCDALAQAIVNGEAPVNQCPVGGAPVGEKIAAIMGVDAGSAEKKVAVVKCNGTCDKAVRQYNYHGLEDCADINGAVPGAGDMACSYGCLGSGSCVRACQFDAIHVRDGVAVVDKEKCKGCGSCVAVCPRHLIELIPYSAEHVVRCSSHAKGPDVRKVCAAGCIACTLCTKQCENDAIHMDNNLAVIDYEKCINCGKCAAKCPQKVIS